ncbi:MAG: Ldh family oxidoreductase [Chloroflexi bacterium]|nr:Ldh family oxidoreductase [Chloroflexota bacterium]
MLKHFQVPDDIAVRVDVAKLRSATEQVFMKCGVPESEAKLGADVLIFADESGIDTHGVSNMLRAYVAGYNANASNPIPEMKIIKETPSTATIDGDGGLGCMIAPKAMEIAIAKAKAVGTGVVAIRNSGHLGAAGYHAMMAVEHDMIGWCMTAGGKSMVPTFGAEPQLGTNPIAFAAPGKNEPPFMFDAAMTSIAGNKIGLANRMGKGMSPGWVANDDGTPDMKGGDTADFAANSVRMQLPLGSTRELGSHKGYGLGVIVDILCGQLSFAPGFGTLSRTRRAHFVAAYSVDAFGDVDEFKANMDGMVSGLAATKPMPGEERVLYAGLPEHETRIERRANGVPLHPEVVDWFRGICAEFEITFDLT